MPAVAGGTLFLSERCSPAWPPQEAKHLVDGGWADAEMALHIGLSRRSPEHARIGGDEGQILALLFGEALSAEAASGA